MDLRARVSELYAKYAFRASPVLDQYFLVNEGAIERAIRYANINSSDITLEVGPGLGFITRELARKSGKVIGVEIDKKLTKLLAEELKEFTNVEIIYDDVLKATIPKFNKIVSNIPYSMSAPLTFKLLEYDFDKAVLFYQREFGEKMLAEPCTSEYGRLSVMAQYYFDVEIKETIPRSYFYPQPKVDSVIVSLKKKKVERDEGFDAFIREIFRYKNKNVSNAVKMGVNKEIDDARKVDSLEIPELIELYKSLK